MNKGMIVQITDEKHKWYPCLLIVSEIKPFGIHAYITIPTNEGGREANGNAFIRLETGQFEIVGQAVVTIKDD